MKMNKKGVIEELGRLVVPLISIAIILVVGFLIMSEAKTQVIDKTSVSTTHINETLASFTTGVFVQLTYSQDSMTLSCGDVYNATATGAEKPIPASTYTCTVGQGIKFDNATAGIVNTSVFVTYTHANNSIAFNATETTQNATGDIPGWLPIFVITIIGALLIGLVSRFRRQ